MYWDDDYGEGQSVKSWLKKKYTRPYLQKSVNDTYFDTRRQICDFRSRFTQFTDDMTLEEMNNQVIMEESLNYLSERLTLGQLLMKKLPEGKEARKEFYRTWLDRLDAKKQIIDDKIGELGPKKGQDLEHAADNLRIWRTNRDRIEEWKYYGRELIRISGEDDRERFYEFLKKHGTVLIKPVGLNAGKVGRDYKKVTMTVPVDGKMKVRLAPGGGWTCKAE